MHVPELALQHSRSSEIGICTSALFVGHRRIGRQSHAGVFLPIRSPPIPLPSRSCDPRAHPSRLPRQPTQRVTAGVPRRRGRPNPVSILRARTAAQNRTPESPWGPALRNVWHAAAMARHATRPTFLLRDHRRAHGRVDLWRRCADRAGCRPIRKSFRALPAGQGRQGHFDETMSSDPTLRANPPTMLVCARASFRRTRRLPKSDFIFFYASIPPQPPSQAAWAPPSPPEL